MGTDKQPSACLHSKKFLEALQLLPARIQTSSFAAAGEDVCGWHRSELPPRSILVDLHNVHFWKMLLELFYRKGFIPFKTSNCLTRSPKNLLKKRDGLSLITSFVQSLPSLWPLSVTNTKQSEPKLLLNLLNSRAFPHSATGSSSRWFKWQWQCFHHHHTQKPTQNSSCIPEATYQACRTCFTV